MYLLSVLLKMFQKLLKYLSITSLGVIFVLFLLMMPAFLDPMFEVRNKSSLSITVQAFWRSETKTIGPIGPGGSSGFSLDDEAGISFRVRYADGRVVETEPIYFGSGIRVNVEVADGEVKTGYDSGFWF